MDIYIIPKGKDKKHKKLYLEALEFFIDRLLGKRLQRKVRSVTVKFLDKLDYGESRGECTEIPCGDGVSDFVIKVSALETLPVIVSTIAHECVHMRQTLSGELVIDVNTWIWKGKRYKYTPEWYNEFTLEELCGKLPWESEAYELEKELARSFFRNHFN